MFICVRKSVHDFIFEDVFLLFSLMPMFLMGRALLDHVPGLVRSLVRTYPPSGPGSLRNARHPLRCLRPGPPGSVPPPGRRWLKPFWSKFPVVPGLGRTGVHTRRLDSGPAFHESFAGGPPPDRKARPGSFRSSRDHAALACLLSRAGICCAAFKRSSCRT